MFSNVINIYCVLIYIACVCTVNVYLLCDYRKTVYNTNNYNVHTYSVSIEFMD